MERIAVAIGGGLVVLILVCAAILGLGGLLWAISELSLKIKEAYGQLAAVASVACLVFGIPISVAAAISIWRSTEP